MACDIFPVMVTEHSLSLSVTVFFNVKDFVEDIFLCGNSVNTYINNFSIFVA